MDNEPVRVTDPPLVSECLETEGNRRKKHLWIWILVGSAVFLFGAFVLLGLLATLVVPNVLQKFSFASRKKAEVDIAAIESALKEYSIRNGGKYPDSLEVLVTPDFPNGRIYLEGTCVPKDPWGHEYIYEPPGPGQPKPIVRSYGKDGQPGGEGDDADFDNISIRESSAPQRRLKN
jgi:general secretion pathway protein G